MRKRRQRQYKPRKGYKPTTLRGRIRKRHGSGLGGVAGQTVNFWADKEKAAQFKRRYSGSRYR